MSECMKVRRLRVGENAETRRKHLLGVSERKAKPCCRSIAATRHRQGSSPVARPRSFRQQSPVARLQRYGKTRLVHCRYLCCAVQRQGKSQQRRSQSLPMLVSLSAGFPSL
jgi:hypothetical protein